MKNISGLAVHFFRDQFRNISLDRKHKKTYKKNLLIKSGELLDHAEKIGLGTRKYELTPFQRRNENGPGPFDPDLYFFVRLWYEKSYLDHILRRSMQWK